MRCSPGLRSTVFFAIPPSMDRMGYNFFLYGVYSEGQACHGRFKNFIKQSEPAQVKASVFKLQSGLSLLLNEGSHCILGSAVELEMTESHWPLFDCLNGYNQSLAGKNFIVKENVSAQLPDGGQVLVATYCLNPEKKHQTLGEVNEAELQNFSTRQSQTLVEKLTDRQRTYIHKLSRARGREIIPVDMALYRELMSLELIVDKGRRLALTNLGVEISHFL